MGRKRKAQILEPELLSATKKMNVETMDFTPTPAKSNESGDQISPSSKISIFKLDVVSCNGRDLSNVELGAPDLEKIWTDCIIRELSDLTGYSSSKSKGGTEIRIQYQLRKPMSIREIAWEAEFNHEREGPRGTEILRCRVVGLSGVRQANIGEKVKITVIAYNFDISPEQFVEWLSRFGKIHDGHR
jgi:hypothetical protein